MLLLNMNYILSEWLFNKNSFEKFDSFVYN